MVTVACAHSAASSSSVTGPVSTGIRSPAAASASAATAPCPPPSVRIATRRPDIRRGARSATSRSASWVGWSTRCAPTAAQAASITIEELVSDAGVGGRAAHRGLAAPGRQQDQRLAGVPQRPGGVEEGPAVDDVLGVDRDGPRPVVADARVQEVDDPEVRLVAERDEAGHAQAAVGQEPGEVEHQVAALAEHGHVAGGEYGVGQLEPGRGVDDAEAVGTDQDGAGVASDRERLGLQPGSLGTRLGEPRGDRHDRPGAGRDGVGHRGHEAARRHAQHGQVDGRSYAAAAACADG